MTMTSLGIDTEPDRKRRSDDDSWRPTIMHAMWGIILALVVWMAGDYSETRKTLVNQVNTDSQRISVLEEQNRNTRESLQRIENGVYELRQQQQERRR